MTFTRTELRALLAHPDSLVRSHADWTREYRGWGWRNLPAYHIDPRVQVATADLYEAKLIDRLKEIQP